MKQDKAIIYCNVCTVGSENYEQKKKYDSLPYRSIYLFGKYANERCGSGAPHSRPAARAEVVSPTLDRLYLPRFPRIPATLVLHLIGVRAPKSARHGISKNN